MLTRGSDHIYEFHEMIWQSTQVETLHLSLRKFQILLFLMETQKLSQKAIIF